MPTDAHDAFKQTFTPSQIPKLLPLVNGKRVSVRTVWRWMARGLLRFDYLGGRRVITLDAVRDLCRQTGRSMPSELEIVARFEAARRENYTRWM